MESVSSGSRAVGNGVVEARSAEKTQVRQLPDELASPGNALKKQLALKARKNRSFI